MVACLEDTTAFHLHNSNEHRSTLLRLLPVYPLVPLQVRLGMVARHRTLRLDTVPRRLEDRQEDSRRLALVHLLVCQCLMGMVRLLVCHLEDIRDGEQATTDMKKFTLGHRNSAWRTRTSRQDEYHTRIGKRSKYANRAAEATLQA